MARRKTVLTTGEIARICNVAPRTVSKWFDSGQLRGYRIPGSRDRRVPVDQLIRFMRAHGIPLNGLDTGAARVLVADDDRDLLNLLSQALAANGGYEVRAASGVFEAGLATADFKPNVILLDVDLPGLSVRELVRAVRDNAVTAGCKVIAMTGPLRDAERQALLDQGLDACIAKPFDAPQLVRTIEVCLAPAC